MPFMLWAHYGRAMKPARWVVKLTDRCERERNLQTIDIRGTMTFNREISMETRRGFHNCVLCIPIGRDKDVMPCLEKIMLALLIQRLYLTKTYQVLGPCIVG
jgi:hypothetical protein